MIKYINKNLMFEFFGYCHILCATGFLVLLQALADFIQIYEHKVIHLFHITTNG